MSILSAQVNREVMENHKVTGNMKFATRCKISDKLLFLVLLLYVGNAVTMLCNVLCNVMCYTICIALSHKLSPFTKCVECKFKGDKIF